MPDVEFRKLPGARVVPAPPTQIYVQIPPSGQFRPAHAQGDKDFWGHGPAVDIWAEVYPLGTKLMLRYSARFQETEGDNTRFEGSDNVEIYDIQAQHPGKRIISIVTPRYEQFQFTDTDTNVDTFFRGATTLINKVVCQGDSHGGLFGGPDDPWIELTFNPAIVTVL